MRGVPVTDAAATWIQSVTAVLGRVGCDGWRRGDALKNPTGSRVHHWGPSASFPSRFACADVESRKTDTHPRLVFLRRDVPLRALADHLELAVDSLQCDLDALIPALEAAADLNCFRIFLGYFVGLLACGGAVVDAVGFW